MVGGHLQALDLQPHVRKQLARGSDIQEQMPARGKVETVSKSGWRHGTQQSRVCLVGLVDVRSPNDDSPVGQQVIVDQCCKRCPRIGG